MGAGLVGVDEVGEDGAPGGVVVAVDVRLGALDNLAVDNVADVAGLAKVVPGDDLDVRGEQVDGLLPAGVPELVAGEEPVLVVLWEFFEEEGKVRLFFLLSALPAWMKG